MEKTRGALKYFLVLLGLAWPFYASQAGSVAVTKGHLVVFADQAPKITGFLRKQGAQLSVVNSGVCGSTETVQCAAKTITALPAQTYVYLLATGDYAGNALALAEQHGIKQRISRIYLFSLPPGIKSISLRMPIWLFTPAQGDPAANQTARKLSLAAREIGADVRYIQVPGTSKSNLSQTHRHHLAARIVLDHLGLLALSEHNRTLLALRDQWRRPPFNNDEFWRHAGLVKRLPVSEQLAQELNYFFRAEQYRLASWPLRKYYAIDLFDYLQATGRDGGRYLGVQNIRGEASYYDLYALKAQQPMIVIGLDDEQNMFRLVNFYRTKQQYSWFDTKRPPDLRAQTLGAFLHMRNPSKNTIVPLKLRSSLTSASFTVTDQDPLRFAWAQQPLVRRVLTKDNQCINCHAYRGTGGGAHHIDALTGTPVGGYALPLEGYPRKIMERFLYDQVNVARKIGVSTNHVRADAHEPLLNAIYGPVTQRGQ